MRIKACLLLFSALLIGCASEPEENGSATNTPPEAAEADSRGLVAATPDHQWAAKLISGAKDWEPVTESATPAHMMNFALCRAPIPGVDDHGPHGADLLKTLNPEHPQDNPKSPANQFIVNPIGRGHFYAKTAVNDEATAEPRALPVGTVIIKEKYNRIEDANKRINPKSFGVMIKQEPGYDPEHGDWEYAYIELDQPNTITGATRGKLASCIDCHANRKQTDYIFGEYPLLAKP